MLGEVERIGAKRVVIDSLDGFRQSAIDPARTIRFMTALLGELRAREITTILIDETMKPSGPEMEMRVEGISALVENLFLLEYMTVGPKMRRLISIVKQRASAHESTAREFFLTGRGIEVAPRRRERRGSRGALRRVLRPSQRAAALAGRRLTRLKMPEAPHNVLVVDDEYASLEVLALMLTGEGFRVFTAADGEQALRQLEAVPIALVITDYKMPKMDGSELCLRMLSDERFRSIPVIFTSATYRQDVPRAKNVVAFFSKPLLFKNVLAAVHRILKSAPPP